MYAEDDAPQLKKRVRVKKKRNRSNSEEEPVSIPPTWVQQPEPAEDGGYTSGPDPYPHKYRRIRRVLSRYRWSRRLGTAIWGFRWKKRSRQETSVEFE